MHTVDLVVNGLPQAARFSCADVEGVLRPLAARIAAAGPGYVLVAGAPGSGKSTVALVLERLAAEQGHRIQALSMDGFHHTNAWLDAHGLRSVKGAPETFDFAGLERALGRLDRWPVYSRACHDVLGETVPVTCDTVVVEGNYLLLDRDPWRRLSAGAALTVWVDTDPALLRERLVGRKVRGGSSREEAEEFFERSDARNVELCLSCRLPAQVELRLGAAEELA